MAEKQGAGPRGHFHGVYFRCHAPLSPQEAIDDSRIPLFSHSIFSICILVSGQFAFWQTDIDLAIYQKIHLWWKKTYQFVSYVQWIPKPKRQEEIVATLCLQLTVNTRNRPINIRLKIIYITQLTTSPMISYEVSFWIPIFLRRVVEKNSMYWLSDMKMDVVHHKGIFISLFSGLHNWKWKKHYSFSPK